MITAICSELDFTISTNRPVDHRVLSESDMKGKTCRDDSVIPVSGSSPSLVAPPPHLELSVQPHAVVKRADLLSWC